MMDRAPPSKRPRLSMACNICRQRKVKCDAEYPKCRNCRLRNQVCVTTDPQRPGAPGVREWLELPERHPIQDLTREANVEKEGVHADEQSPLEQQHQQRQSPWRADDPGKKVTGVSPVHHQFDTSLNIEHGTDRMKIMGGSSSQCLAKSLDVYFKAARLRPVSACFRYGMRHAEEFEMPLVGSFPALPELKLRDQYISVYHSRFHPLYPIFVPSTLRASVEQLATIPDYKQLPRDIIPTLVSTYLIMSLGCDEVGQCLTEEGEKYLQAAACLLSHIIVIPYLPAVQTLLLFTLVYRGRNQEGLAWQTLGMAVRIAYTLGAHRPPSGSSSSSSQPSEDRNLSTQIWAVCCCLDMMMQLESGRPSVISSEHISPVSAVGSESPFLQWHLGLAEYQGGISQHIYNYRSGARNVRQILLDTARLDRQLLSWANQIPAEMRPGNDIFCAEDEFHIVAFISIQYHETLIALHRAALIAPISTFDAEVAKHCADEPCQFRLRNGESICVNSARAIAKLSIELSERDIDSRLIPAGPSLLACIVLAIHLMKHPGSRLQAMDLQLLKACLEYSSAQLASCNSDPRFMEGLAAIYDQIYSHLQAYSTSNDRNISSLVQKQQNKPMPQARQRNPNISSTAKPSSMQNPLLTPSTYDDNVPTHWGRVARDLDPGNSSVTGETWAPHEQQQYRQGTFAMPQPDTDQYGSHQPNTSGTAVGPQDPASLLDQLATSGDCANNLDELFPFDGYNVEDLWNWMLYFDSPRPLEEI